MILHFDGEFCINSLQWGDVFPLQVSIPHTESCAVTTYKEDSYDIFMEAKPYLCMGSSSLVLSELRG